MNHDESVVKHFAKIGEEALDEAYGYGISGPESFGAACNLRAAEALLNHMDFGHSDIEYLSSVAHNAWGQVAQTFEDPIYKTNPHKRTQRLLLANSSYEDLSEEEKEKDRVLARRLLQEYELFFCQESEM